MKHLLKVYNLSSNNMCEKLVGWKSLLQGDLFVADLYTGYLFLVDLLNSLLGDCSIRMTALLG